MARCGNTQLAFITMSNPDYVLVRDATCGQITCPLCCHGAARRLEHRIARYAQQDNLHYFITITSGEEDANTALNDLQELWDKLRADIAQMDIQGFIRTRKSKDGKRFKPENAERRWRHRIEQYITDDRQYNADNLMRGHVTIDLARAMKIHYKSLSEQEQRAFREEYKDELESRFNRYKENAGLSVEEQNLIESNVRGKYRPVLERVNGKLKYIRVLERGDNGHYHYHILCNYPLPRLLIAKHAKPSSQIWDCRYTNSAESDDSNLRRLSEYVTKLPEYVTKFQNIIDQLGDRRLVTGSKGYNLLTTDIEESNNTYIRIDEGSYDTGARSIILRREEFIEFQEGRRSPKSNTYARKLYGELIKAIPADIDDKRLSRIRDALYISRHIAEDTNLPTVSPCWNKYAQAVPVSPEQSMAVNDVGLHKYTAILGAAGTGKTSVAAAILQVYEVEPESTLIVSHLGRAAVIIRDRIPPEYRHCVFTIRKVLGWQKGPAGFRRGFDNVIPGIKWVIVDEISMLPMHDLVRLLQSIPEDARFIFMGDDAQIPAFEGTNLGYEMRMLSGVHLRYLKTNHRSTHEVTVLAQKILDGKSPPYEQIDTDKLAQMAVDGWQIICNVHRIANEINDKARQLQSIDRTIQTRNGWYGIGDKIMFSFNSYIIDNDYKNGQIGRIIDVNDEIVIVESNGELYFLSQQRLMDEVCIEPSFAVTINKVQGSEFPRVAVVLADLRIRLDEDNPQISQNVLYTALTRAQQEVKIFADVNAMALTSTRDIRRPVIDVAKEWYEFCTSRGLPLSISQDQLEQWLSFL